MKIAIQSHSKRGIDIIEILVSLGGKNVHGCWGDIEGAYYFIDSANNIDWTPDGKLPDFKYYTLEEFEKEFPFKVGDEVTIITKSPYKIVALEYFMGRLCYKLDNGLNYSSKVLTLYKEMKKERNITLTLKKAKEWYTKGGELKEVALQAYSEEELTKVELPKTWEEFCDNYPVKKGECWLGVRDTINPAPYNLINYRDLKNWIPSKESAEAHLALIQLEQLRDCYRQGDIPDFNNSNEKYCIIKTKDYIHIMISYTNSHFLSFTKKEVAEEYLKNFEPLIKQAGDLI